MNDLETRSDPYAFPWRRLRDEAIAAELRDTLAHDGRTTGLVLDVTVRGGVAHVAGEVESEAQRRLLRDLLRRQAGLFAVWDRICLAGQRLEVLDVGCGATKQVPGAIGLDCEAGPGIDCVADLEARLPFADDRFDHVFAVHVLEHIRDLVGLMRELHRILRPTGVLHVLSPHWRFVNAVADPTHVRFLDVQTMKYFCGAKPGVPPWRPLSTGAAEDNIFADLQPVKDGPPASGDELARWFT
ncbi:methyltransferase domain-containing protein [Nannocystis radixulma]|uniref:Methyltransferase domain-containing protein n=1 Tax=Nannocystis radixulma TaxID=2995305 RepID=A0ABT5B3E7_9BACT|nr:methyltransferase domain-containing protein [Nannocystis radixulma]MDC0667596.1 methyltransferase domain-containing protein [Nannocystis radixulma]